jgi:hypothetical protein
VVTSKKKKKKTQESWALVAHTVILATRDAEIGRLKVQGPPRQIVPESPISKITKAKWTGGVAQTVEHLL